VTVVEEGHFQGKAVTVVEVGWSERSGEEVGQLSLLVVPE
jgi:hypothetical protein